MSKFKPFRVTEKIYEVLYSRSSTRKHKRWEFDGYLLYKYEEFFNGDNACMTLVKELNSKKQPVFVHIGVLLVSEEAEFEDGHRCCLGGYDIEIQKLVKKQITVNEEASTKEGAVGVGEASGVDLGGSESDEPESEDEQHSGSENVAVPAVAIPSRARSTLGGFVRPTLSMPIVPAPAKQKTNKRNSRKRGHVDSEEKEKGSYTIPLPSYELPVYLVQPSMSDDREMNNDDEEAFSGCSSTTKASTLDDQLQDFEPENEEN